MALLTSAIVVECRAEIPQDSGVSAGSNGSGRRVAIVAPRAQTQPVPTGDDAADDPAIWIHTDDPSKSLVIGTDKKRGLGVYRLDGSLLAFHEVGMPNNTDLRQGVRLRGWNRSVDVLAASDRADNTIRLFEITAHGGLRDIASIPIRTGLDEVYGLCMHSSPVTGDTHVFINDKDGRVQQWKLLASVGREPMASAQLVRAFHVGGQVEGMAADDELGWLYIGEERTGLWRYHAEPWMLGPEHAFSSHNEGDHERVLVAAAAPAGPLEADVEGVDIARMGPLGAGWLIVSSQGADRFDVFERRPPNAYVGSFRVGEGAGIDAVTHTDGLAVFAGDVGPLYPGGLLVVQDDEKPDSTQNFKMVALGDVVRALGLDDSWSTQRNNP